MFVALLKLSWFIRGSFFFLLGRDGFPFARGGTNEGSLIFLCFSLAIEERILFMRGRVFLVVAPRVFYLGGFFVSGEGIRFFCFSLANREKISILGLFSFVKKYFSKPAGRETRNAS